VLIQIYYLSNVQLEKEKSPTFNESWALKMQETTLGRNICPIARILARFVTYLIQSMRHILNVKCSFFTAAGFSIVKTSLIGCILNPQKTGTQSGRGSKPLTMTHDETICYRHCMGKTSDIT
jgi:hypothetical protein